MSRPLTPKQAKFVAEYLSGKNGKDSAIAAGYPPTNAINLAYRLLHESPAVMEAVKAARQKMVAKGVYNLEKAMENAERALQFAIQTDNANAYVKAQELMAKLNGLLVEKHDVRQVGFSLVINRGGAKKEAEAEEIEAEEAIEAEIVQEGEDDLFS